MSEEKSNFEKIREASYLCPKCKSVLICCHNPYCLKCGWSASKIVAEKACKAHPAYKVLERSAKKCLWELREFVKNLGFDEEDYPCIEELSNLLGVEENEFESQTIENKNKSSQKEDSKDKNY